MFPESNIVFEWRVSYDIILKESKSNLQFQIRRNYKKFYWIFRAKFTIK